MFEELQREAARLLGHYWSVEARVEAFNALNWLRPKDPNTTLSSTTFGQIMTAWDPRIMQFGLKYQF